MQDKGAERLSAADNIELARAMVLANRRMTVVEVANHMQISRSSVYEIIRDRLNFRKVCARWVPKHLTEAHKRKRLDIRQRLLDRYDNKDGAFLKRAVAVDET